MSEKIAEQMENESEDGEYVQLDFLKIPHEFKLNAAIQNSGFEKFSFSNFSEKLIFHSFKPFLPPPKDYSF